MWPRAICHHWGPRARQLEWGEWAEVVPRLARGLQVDPEDGLSSWAPIAAPVVGRAVPAAPSLVCVPRNGTVICFTSTSVLSWILSCVTPGICCMSYIVLP